MFNQKPFSRFLIIASLVWLSMLGITQAQDLNSQMALANKAWGGAKYEECQQILEKIVVTYSARAPLLYGPKFGTIHYRKGLAELKLANIAKRSSNKTDAEKWFGKAIDSFQACHDEYPNGAEGMAETINTSHKAALQRWAEACMGRREYEKGLSLYEKFLKERKPGKDKILPTEGGFYINLAICNFLMETPNIPKGISHFETAIKNKVKMKTQEAGIVAGFLALSQGVIAKKNESAMVDFLNKNRKDISLTPYKMYEFSPVFMKLASNALAADMYIAATNLYALIPGAEDVEQDLKVRIEQLAGRKGIVDGNNTIELARLKASLKKLRTEKRTGKSHDAQVLLAMVYLHNKANNQRGVLGALEQLELYYKKSIKRETNLFSLIRVYANMGDTLAAEQYGTTFLEKFPTSEHTGDVQRVMLTSLFFTGKYEKSLEKAKSFIGKTEKGKEYHDVCLFILAGSYFYLGDFEKAQPFLEQHVKEYPKSKFRMHARYFEASNLTRLQYWDKAAKFLDAFIAEYNDPSVNFYMPNALFDRANCHFLESENASAMSILKRIENDFPDSGVIGMTYNMQGNILEADTKLEDAEQSYLRALESAETRQNKDVAAESLSYLIGILGEEGDKNNPNPRLKDVIPHYDRFLKDYPDSQFKPQVLVYGIPAMKAAGREQEALDNLENIVGELSREPNPRFMEECVNAYSDTFLSIKGNTPAKLKSKYYNFKGIDLDNKRTLALLRIALIGVFEEQLISATKEKNNDLRIRYAADIKTLFNDLKSQFRPKELTNFVLLRVADYLREKTSAPKQSLPYYNELLGRRDKGDLELKALLGVADIMGGSESVEDNKKAIANLERVHASAKEDGDSASQGKALFRIVEIHNKLENWEGLGEKARQYLDEKHTKKAAQASYLYAKSFDKRKNLENALSNYGLVYARYTGYIAISAPSVKRVMEIMWNRDLAAGAQIGAGDKKITLKKGDKQTAYELIGSKYIRSTRRIYETNRDISDEEKALWEEVELLVKKYENSGQVKTLAEIAAEKK